MITPQKFFLDLMLSIRWRVENLTIIISNDYCIYIQRAYLKSFLVLIDQNMEKKIDKNSNLAR